MYCDGPGWAASDWGSSGDSEYTNLSLVQTPEGFGEGEAVEADEEVVAPTAFVLPEGAEVIDLTTATDDGPQTIDLTGEAVDQGPVHMAEARIVASDDDDPDAIILPASHVTVMRPA